MILKFTSAARPVESSVEWNVKFEQQLLSSCDVRVWMTENETTQHTRLCRPLTPDATSHPTVGHAFLLRLACRLPRTR